VSALKGTSTWDPGWLGRLPAEGRTAYVHCAEIAPVTDIKAAAECDVSAGPASTKHTIGSDAKGTVAQTCASALLVLVSCSVSGWGSVHALGKFHTAAWKKAGM